MRRAVLVMVLACALTACQTGIPPVDWTCQYDASENRPLSDPDASLGPDGALPASVCETTCGTPVKACTFVSLEAGVRGAVCPVCTF